LKSDSPAEEWYNDPETPKDKWKSFQENFLLKFPNPEKAKKTKAELEREMGTMKIATEVLGETETYKGTKMYTHTAFAEKLFDLAKQAKIEATTSGLYVVRDNLPEVLREKVSDNQEDWTTFVAAIKAIEMGHIRDGVRKHKERIASEMALRREIQTLNRQLTTPAAKSPDPQIANITERLARTTVTPQPRQYNVAQASPFAGYRSRQGNSRPYQQQGSRQPATEDERAELQMSLQRYPMQPDTAAGLEMYRNQMRTYTAEHGERRPDRTTGFPLRPGGAPPGSRECYGCGKTGHRSTECKDPNPLRIFEGNFRALCGNILLSARPPQVSVNHVAEEIDEFAWADGATAVYVQQGNEGGPSA